VTHESVQPLVGGLEQPGNNSNWGAEKSRHALHDIRDTAMKRIFARSPISAHPRQQSQSYQAEVKGVVKQEGRHQVSDQAIAAERPELVSQQSSYIRKSCVRI
jgi:hypothetical protein